MDISVVIPLYNEDESLGELYSWIDKVMKANSFSYEVIFVNDGSTDRSWQVIDDLSKQSNNVKGISFRRNYGKSPALYCGFKEAQGDVVVTMDADLQDSPDEIPELYRMIRFQRSSKIVRPNWFLTIRIKAYPLFFAGRLSLSRMASGKKRIAILKEFWMRSPKTHMRISGSFLLTSEYMQL